MDIYKLKDLPPAELASVIDSESIGTEEASYMKPLTAEELAEYRHEFTQAAIEKAELEDEFKIEKEKHKRKLEPVQHRLSESLKVVKQRGIWEKGLCHLIADYDNKLVHVIDSQGNHINTRMMKPEERQFRITPNQKAS